MTYSSCNWALRALPWAMPSKSQRTAKKPSITWPASGPYADRTKYPLPCLVLLVLNMPVLSGFEVLEWLRQQPQFHALPVVVLTASSHQSDKVKALQLGANQFITKPTDMSRLSKLLADLKTGWLPRSQASLP